MGAAKRTLEISPIGIQSSILHINCSQRPSSPQLKLKPFSSMRLDSNTGSPAISERDLLNIPFRKVDSEAENQIIQAVQRSSFARENARLSLDRVKQAVEIAIESSEEAAMKHLAKEIH